MSKVIDVSVDQTDETKLDWESDGEGITVRYASFRSAETREKNKKGQDYLKFHLEPGRVFFVLCDGVSGSFFGDIGAKILGNRIIRWLTHEISLENIWVYPKNPEINNSGVQRLIPELTNILDNLRDEATKEIYLRDTSKFVELQREVLDELRETQGTHANFTSGIIEAPRKGLEYGRLLVFWLGDAKLRWFVGMRDQTNLFGAEWNTEERWSSKNGVIGSIHGYMDVTHKVSTLVAHSDGFDPFPVQWYQPFLDPEVLNSYLVGLWERSNNDDVSLIEVNIQNKAYPFTSGLSQPQKSIPLQDQPPSFQSQKEPARTTDIPAQTSISSSAGDQTFANKNQQESKTVTALQQLPQDTAEKYPRSNWQGKQHSLDGNASPNYKPTKLREDYTEEGEERGLSSWLKKHNIEPRVFLTIGIILLFIILIWFGFPLLCKLSTFP